jgi:hypothetical protein
MEIFAQVCEAESEEAFDEVVRLLTKNYHPWTQKEFCQAFTVQEAEPIQKHMDIDIPAVLRDVIVDYAIPDIQALFKDVERDMVRLCGFDFVPTFQIPESVKTIMKSPVHLADAVFLTLVCKTFGKIGLQLVLQSISGNLYARPQAVALRAVLLSCMYDAGMICRDAGVNCPEFERVQYAKIHGPYK